MMIRTKQEEIAITDGGRKLGEILQRLTLKVEPGITTEELDRYAEEWIRVAGGKPSFKGYKSHKSEPPFPASLCVSVNEEVVHGIPSGRILHDGDIIGLDIGMMYDGLFTDTAVTIPVGKVSEDVKKLIEHTEEALKAGIGAARNNNRVGDIGAAVEVVGKLHGYGIVRELVGHGVGRAVHEDPQIPNYGRKGKGEKLIAGMVIAIEPMFTLGNESIELGADGWTWMTKDRRPASHCEHTIRITEDAAEILTTRVA